MYKMTVTYPDFDGTERKEDFYFHLSKSEITKMNFATPGGMEAYLNKIINSKDGEQIMNTFDMFITKSYGVKSEDGKNFRKSPEILEEFLSSAAYDQIFMELCTDSDKAAKFVNGIIPADLAKEIDKMNKNNVTAMPGAAPVGVEAKPE